MRARPHFGRPELLTVINGFANLTVQGWIHTIFSSIGILVGAEQLLRTRRDTLHKWLGYVYVTCMVVGDAAILTVYRFNHHFNVFHVGAIVMGQLMYEAPQKSDKVIELKPASGNSD